MTQEDFVGNDITIYVDSQAAIKALNKLDTKNALVKNCKTKLNRLSEGNDVKLSWIPAHVGYIGNEIADRLAKLGAKNPRNQEKLEVGVSKKFYRNSIRTWGTKKHQKRWDGRTEYRQTGMMLPTVDHKCWKLISKFNRRKMMHVTQIITGHNTLNRHLAIMKIKEDPKCSKCNEGPETIEHLIKNCPFYMQKRFEKLGEYFLERNLHEYKLQKIISFVTSTKRLEENDQ